MKKLYNQEVNIELVKTLKWPKQFFSKHDLAGLPEPVQYFFDSCGYLGKEIMSHATIEWGDTFLKLSPNKKWLKLKCYQFNSVVEPARIVYMQSKLLGVLPFEGRDKYQNGYGNMRIKLLKFISIADAKGREIDISALVTVLAECFLVPACALQSYLRWTALDKTSAKAELTYNNTKVSGIFYFNKAGEFVRFMSDDRYYTENGREYKQMRWSVYADNYVERQGIRFPSLVKAVWHTAWGDYEYFKGNIENIIFS